MKANAAPISVADYCLAQIAGTIKVNRDYQREENVWSSYMKSYFIESILLGYPIPKLFLYVNYDLHTRKSIKEIVDGQQRSAALRQFYENNLQVSVKIETKEFHGKKYRHLSEQHQQLFLSYSLPIDEFTGVGEDEIREAFTRMNVNNIALNPEELRNAKYRGDFKFFLVRFAKSFREFLLSIKLISRRDVIRMADLRMFAEIFYIFDRGIHTTKSEQIDDLYKRYDSEFPREDNYTEICSKSVQFWLDNAFGDYEGICRRHVFYTHVAAIAEHLYPGQITSLLDPDQQTLVDQIVAKKIPLHQLSAALGETENGNDVHPLKEFIDACTAKTNVGHEKLIRFSYLLGSLK